MSVSERTMRGCTLRGFNELARDRVRVASTESSGVVSRAEESVGGRGVGAGGDPEDN